MAAAEEAEEGEEAEEEWTEEGAVRLRCCDRMRRGDPNPNPDPNTNPSP